MYIGCEYLVCVLDLQWVHGIHTNFNHVCHHNTRPKHRCLHTKPVHAYSAFSSVSIDKANPYRRYLELTGVGGCAGYGQPYWGACQAAVYKPNILSSSLPLKSLTFLRHFMHLGRGLKSEYPVFEGALHAYPEIETAYTICEAPDAVEHDDEHRPELGPTPRAVSAYEFCTRKRGQRR